MENKACECDGKVMKRSYGSVEVTVNKSLRGYVWIVTSGDSYVAHGYADTVDAAWAAAIPMTGVNGAK